MAHAPHILLWQRVREALAVHAAIPPGFPTEMEIAEHARSRLGTDLVQRFVQHYYSAHKYGEGEGALSDDEAHRLVQALEAMSLAGARVQVRAATRAPAAPVVASARATQESSAEAEATLNLPGAVAYGDEEEKTEQRARREASRRKAEEERRARELAAAETARRRREEEERQRAEEGVRRQEAEEAQRRREAAEAERVRREEAEAADERRRKEAAFEKLLADAASLSATGDARRASVLLEEALQQKPDDLGVQVKLADAQGAAGNYTRAAQLYGGLIKCIPPDAISFNNHGYNLYRIGQHDSALVSLREAVKRDPHYVRAWTNIGATFGATKDYGQAVKAYNKAVKVGPNDVAAWRGLGWAYWAVQNYREGARAYRSAAELEPIEAANSNDCSAVYDKLDNACRFATHLRKRVRWRYPRVLPDLYVRMPSQDEIDNRQGEDLIALADKAIARGVGSDVKNFVQRASGHWLRREYRKALEDYDEASRRNDLWARTYESRFGERPPRDAFPRGEYHDLVQGRAAALYEAGDYDGAISVWTDSIRQNQNDPRFLQLKWRGLVYFAKRQYHDAINDFGEAIEQLDSQKDPWTVIYLLINRGYARLKMDQGDGASEDLSRAIDLADSNRYSEADRYLASAYYGRGCVRRETGDTGNGDADIATAIAINPIHALASAEALEWESHSHTEMRGPTPHND